MTDDAGETCWICRERAANSAQGLSCSHCDSTLTQPYDAAWKILAKYLHQNWQDIVKRGSFDVTRAFGSAASAGALQVHLYFVKRLGGKLLAGQIPVDLSRFSAALLQGLPHPEITLLVANCALDAGKLVSYESEVSVLKRDDEVYSAVWMNLAFPVAVKVCYLKRSAPVAEPEGFPWHPTRQRKIVKLSPYKGDTRPVHARRDLRL